MKGKIFVVGTGPGFEEYLSLRAIEVLKQCDVVVGYKTYIALIEKLIEWCWKLPKVVKMCV